MTIRFSHSMLAVGLTTLLAVSIACEDEDNVVLKGNWVDTGTYISGVRRGGAVCFVIDNTAYVGTGANTNKTEERERFRDFYKIGVKYDAELGRETYTGWSARANKTENSGAVASMPDEAPARNGAVGFALNGKGYVGLGYDGVNFLKDFWCYDPKTNSWSEVEQYPGDSVRYATAFVIGDTAYVCGGEDFDNNVLNDCYAFDGQKWHTVASMKHPRTQAASFVINGLGYVVGGQNNGAIDWFEYYNPKTGNWTYLNRTSDRTDDLFDDDYTLAAYGSTAFVLNDGTPNARAYLVTGGAAGVGAACWEYNPYYDYWVQKTSFEGGTRKFAVSFVLNINNEDIGFVATGAGNDIGASGSGGTFYSDMWLFNPYTQYEPKD